MKSYGDTISNEVGPTYKFIMSQQESSKQVNVKNLSWCFDIIF